MKKTLLVLVLLLSACQNSKIENIKSVIYDSSDIYVEMQENEMREKLNININQYHTFLAFKSLIVLNQKEIYVFYKPSNDLKIQLSKLTYSQTEIDDYLIVLSKKDENLIASIKKILV